MEIRPKILIVTRGVWDDGKGTSSTLSNLFSEYGADRLATLYIESRLPKTKCCHLFFQIPEIALMKKIFHWKNRVGIRIDTRDAITQDQENIQAEEQALNYVRGHRSVFFLSPNSTFPARITLHSPLSPSGASAPPPTSNL